MIVSPCIAAEARAMFSLRKASPVLTVKVKLNNGRSYQYLSNFIVEEDSLVIIGGGATEAQMGIVDSVFEGAKISSSKSVRLAYVFKSSCDKKDIKEHLPEAPYIRSIDDCIRFSASLWELYFAHIITLFLS